MKNKLSNTIILFLILLTLMFGLVSCKKDTPPPQTVVETPEIVTTEPVIVTTQPTPILCGNNKLEEGEICDGKDDKACPGRCIPNGQDRQCDCYSPGEMPKEVCEAGCTQSINIVPGLTDYVSHSCSDTGFCTIIVKPESITTKKYLDQFTLGCGYKIVLRSEVDAPFLKGGKIRFKINVEDFDNKTCKSLTVRTVSLMDTSEVLADIFPEQELPDLDSSLEDQFIVTYETKEMAESRYVVLRVFYSYISMQEQYDTEGNPYIAETPVRETADLRLAVPLIVVNPGYKSDKYEIIYNPRNN